MSYDSQYQKIIRFERLLTCSEFETKLRGSSPTTLGAKGWTKEVLKNGLFIDLSKVEFAEFSALAQVALLIEGAARHGIKVDIALPLIRERIGEEEFIEKHLSENELVEIVRHRVVRREKALRFMKVSGFIDAIKVEHVPNAKKLIDIDYTFDRRSDLDSENKSENTNVVKADKFEYLLKKIFPMTWFEPQTEEELLKSQKFATAVLGLEEIGLNKDDAKMLAGTLLNELVENVYNYADDSKSRNVSCRPFALVGAIVLDNGYQFRPENYHKFLENFIEQLDVGKYRDFNEDSTNTDSEFRDQANINDNKFVRIVVGDSGLGIPQVLKEYFTPERENEIPKFENQEATENDKVLLWSLNRWSTSDFEKSRIKRGTRGLWRINRCVRSYHGFLTIRSDDSLVSVVHGLGSSKAEKGEKKPRYLFGTFVDICLIPSLQSNQPILLPETKSTNQPSFDLLFFDAASNTTLPDNFQHLLIEKLSKSVINDSKCVILAIDNIPLDSSKNTQSFFYNLLVICADLANHGALAVIALNRNWKQLDGSFESASLYWESENSEQNKTKVENKNVADPILILDRRGEAKWFAGHQIIRRIFSNLIKVPTCSIALEKLNEFTSQNINYKSITGLLRDQPDIIEFAENRVQLRFTSKHIFEKTINHVETLLRDFVENASPESVERGVFRIPTLELVNRWINVEDLLKDESLVNLAAFAMSCKLKMSSSEIVDENQTIARIDNTSYEFVDNFTKSLNENSKIVSLSGGLGIFENEDLVSIESEQKVIVCANIVMTSNTLKHILAKLIRWRTFPSEIVCVFDARSDNSIDEIECLGKKFRISSLTKINIALKKDAIENLINVDPILRRPLSLNNSNSPRSIKYKISQEEFLEWCKTNDDTLYLGHVRGATGKHFLSYVNGQKTIEKQSSISDKIVNLFYSCANEWLVYQQQTISEKKLSDIENSYFEAVEIWHISPDKFAVLFAESLRDKFIEENNKKYNIKKIQRAPLGGKWVFPSEVEKLKQGTKVIIVDWGALTSGTIQQLIRLAIQSGADNVIAMAFLSQMHPNEELALTKIQNFYREETCKSIEFTSDIAQPSFFDEKDENITELKTIQKTIPVKIEFFSHLNLRFYMPTECPLCNLQNNFQKDSENCQIRILKNYAEKRQKSLQFKDIESIFSNKFEDVYDERLESAESVHFLEIWQELSLALYSTEKRYEVYCDLKKLSESNNINEKVAWIRALSLDPNWLKLHPLRYQDLRKIVTEIAIYIINNNQGLSDQVIQQALIVLRVVSVIEFVSHLHQFFKKFIGSYSLIQQLLYDLYSYINKDFLESEGTISQIQKQLLLCQDELIDGKEKPEHSELIEYHFAISSLIRNTDYRINKQDLLKKSITDVWTDLLLKYKNPMRSHQNALTAMNFVYFVITGLQEPELYPTKDEINTALFKWEECQKFLSTNLFPYLSRLQDVFLGDFYSSKFLPEDNIRLRKLFGLAENIDQSTEILREGIIYIYNNLNSLKSETISYYVDEVKWWSDFFLEIDTGAESDAEAKFLKVIKNCPTDLRECLRTIDGEMKSARFNFTSSFELNDECSVFCDQELLKNCIEQIIENACKDSEINNTTIFIHWELEKMTDTEDVIVLCAKNTGTEHRIPGKGLGYLSLNQKLKDFKSKISGRKLDGSNDQWSYEVRLQLLK